MTEVANLNIKADATSVDAAKNSLRGLKSEAKEVGSAIRDMADKINAADAAMRGEYLASRQSATAHMEAAKAAHQAATATQANANAVRMSAEEYRRLTGATREQTTATQAAAKAQDAITDAIRKGQPVTAQAIKDAGGLANAMKIMENAHKGSGKAIEEHTANAHKSRIAMGGLTIQTSTFVRELLVLGREAGRGDWTRFAGSLSILGQAAGLLPLLMTAAGAAVAGLGVVAAATFAIFLKGEKEFNGFQNSLIATGNYAGLTADKMETMAHRISESQNTGIRGVKAGIESLTASGKYQADVIDQMMQAAISYSKLTGQSVEDIVKGYETMKGGITRWAVKHTEVYHDLTFAQVDYIDKLEKMGKHHEAELYMMEAINKEVKDRTIPQFGYLQTMLRDVAKTASGMWDSILGWGRPKTLGTQLDSATKELNAALEGQKAHPNDIIGASGSYEKQQLERRAERIAALQTKVNGLRSQIDAENAKAAADAKKAEEEDDKIRKKFDNGGFRPYKKEAQPQVDKVKEKQEAIQAEIDGNRGLATAYDLSSAAGFRAQAMKKALTDAAVTNGKATQFEALELQAAVTKTLADGAKQVVAIEQRTKATEDANRMMAATGVSQGIANQAVQDAIAIAGLQAAADNATGNDKRDLLDLIIRTKDAQVKANEASRDAFMINAERGLRDSNAELDIELGLINATNREREVRLAQMRAERDLQRDKIDPKSARGTAYIEGKKGEANKKQDLADGIGNTIKQQQFYLSLLDEMASRTTDAASSMASAFGGVGAAITTLTTVFSDHYVAVQKMQLDYDQRVKDANGNQEKIRAIESARLDASRQQNLQYYGDVIGAAAEMFSKKSMGYKVLHAAEQGYRLYEFAMSAASIAVKAAEAAGKIPLNSAITASNVAAGASAMFASLGPLGFPAVAAMVAVMAGLGFSDKGGGGSVDFKARQDQQGTGSVMGDKSAKSDSIAHSLEQAGKNSNALLEYNSEMAASLRKIEGALSVTANSIVRAMTSGGSMDTSGLGLGSNRSGPGLLARGMFPVANLFPSLFGTKVNSTLADQGLNFGAQSLQSIMAGGLQGSSYTDVATQTKKKLFGITYSNNTKLSSNSTDLDGQLRSDLTALVTSLRDGVLSAAKVIGLDGASAVLDAFSVNIGQISLKDMTGDEIQSALEAVFSKVGDDMATAVLPALTQLQKIGEGAMETLVRVARDYQVVDVTLRSIGKTFGTVGVASLAAREALIDLAGGLDEFTGQASYFYDNFLTTAEQLAPISNVVSLEMKKMGLEAVTTKDQFKTLVMGLDLSTTGGRDMYSALMKLAPAFDKVATSAETAAQNARDLAQQHVDDAKKLVDQKQDNLVTAYTQQSDAIQSVLDKFRQFNTQLKSFKQQLLTGDVAGLSPQDKYLSSKSAFEATSARARGGDSSAIEQLQSVGQSFLDASRDYFASGTGYFGDLESVKSAVDAVIGFTDNQISIGERTQQALDDLVNTFAENNGLLLRVQEGVVSMDGTFKLTGEQISNAVFSQDGHLVDIRTATVDGAGNVVTSVNTAAISIGGSIQGGLAVVGSAIGGLQSAMATYNSAVQVQTSLLQEQLIASQAATDAANTAILNALNNANGTGTGGATPGTATGATYSDVHTEVRTERPDVVQEATNLLATADRNSPWYNQHGLDGGIDGYIDWWLNNKPPTDTYNPDGKGFATGGNSVVGGMGGTDSKRISLRATPGELVSVQTPGQIRQAAAFNARTEELLEQVVELLDGANQQRVDAHRETTDLARKQLSEASASKRAQRIKSA